MELRVAKPRWELMGNHLYIKKLFRSILNFLFIIQYKSKVENISYKEQKEKCDPSKKRIRRLDTES
jgi:hypothetical protein